MSCVPPNLAPIGHAHLPGVMAVQARAYGPALLESPEVLGSKLRAPGGTCWGAFSAGQGGAAPALCAYAIAHALPQGQPLVLNKPLTFTAAPVLDDWLYVHDIAVDPAFAGSGLAARLLAEVLGAGRGLGLRQAMLVAVQGAQAYWVRHGFVAATPPMPVQGFGGDAVWMARAL